MSEHQESPSPTEIRKAEKMMSPVEMVMSKAVSEIMSHEEILKEVGGLSTEKIEEIAGAVGEKAKAEFKQKEKGDPLLRMAQVLKEAAETEEEKTLAEAGAQRLEQFRSSWKEWVSEERLRAEYAGETFDLFRAVKTAAAYHTAPTQVDNRGSSEIRPYTIFLEAITDEDKGKIKPSEDFMERVLKGLGAISEDGSLADFKLFPTEERGLDKPFYRETALDDHRAERVPTTVSGVDVGINWGKRWNVIYASMNLEAFKKVIDFSPTS